MEPELLEQFAKNLQQKFETMACTGWVYQAGHKMIIDLLKNLQENVRVCAYEIDLQTSEFYHSLLRCLLRTIDSMKKFDNTTKALLPGDRDLAVVKLLKSNGITVTLKECSMMGFVTKEDYRRALQIILLERVSLSAWRKFENTLNGECVCTQEEFDLARRTYPFTP